MSLPEGVEPLTPGEWQATVIADPYIETAGPFYRLELGEANEPMRLGFVIRSGHCNRLGSCHGGMLATFLDLALGFIGKTACGDEIPTPTISLSMDFLQPGLLGQWVETRARLVHQTRRMFFAEGTLVTAGGPIVRANAIYRRASQ